MSLNEFVVLASEAGGTEEHSPWPYVIGGVVLLTLLVLLAMLLAFAGGREHS